MRDESYAAPAAAPVPDLASVVRASLLAHEPTRALAPDVQLTVEESVVRLEGELPSVEAKRRVVVAAARVLPNGVALSDQLCVRPLIRMDAAQLREAICRELTGSPLFRRCTISSWTVGSVTLMWRPQGDAEGEICVAVNGDVVRLDGRVPSHMHRRVAEVIAWWCFGARAVDNALSILSEQADGDEPLRDALSQVLKSDVLLYGSSIEVSVDDGEVTLGGAVPDASARELAELYTWFAPGVVDVRNELELAAPL